MNFQVYLAITILIVVGSILTGCDAPKQNKNKNFSQEQITEKLVEANKAAIITEDEQIDKLIAINNWSFDKSPTGLRYSITKKGNGAQAQSGQVVRFEYEVKLIDGDVIYSSQLTGPKEFRLGSGGVESGLEEGLLLMRVGDKATFIIPSYLAHGLAGDQDKIPQKATLIYTLKLIDIQ